MQKLCELYIIAEYLGYKWGLALIVHFITKAIANHENLQDIVDLVINYPTSFTQQILSRCYVFAVNRSNVSKDLLVQIISELRNNKSE